MQRRAEGDQLPVCARARPRVSSYSPAIPGCLPLVTRAGPRLKANPRVFHVISFWGKGAWEAQVTETLTKMFCVYALAIVNGSGRGDPKTLRTHPSQGICDLWIHVCKVSLSLYMPLMSAAVWAPTAPEHSWALLVGRADPRNRQRII